MSLNSGDNIVNKEATSLPLPSPQPNNWQGSFRKQTFWMTRVLEWRLTSYCSGRWLTGLCTAVVSSCGVGFTSAGWAVREERGAGSREWRQALSRVGKLELKRTDQNEPPSAATPSFLLPQCGWPTTEANTLYPQSKPLSGLGVGETEEVSEPKLLPHAKKVSQHIPDWGYELWQCLTLHQLSK